MDLEKICTSVREIATQAGSFIKNEKNNISSDNIEIKGLHNFVTYVDKTAEEKIVQQLQKLLPEAGFITEEGTNKVKGEKYNWVIDPLDGTTNYIHSLPPYAVSIALMEHNEVILGVIHEIVLDESFYAWKGSKAYLNGGEINVTNTSRVKDSLIATGFPYTDYHRVDTFMKTINYLIKNSHGVRRLGSAATDLAYVACGRFEGFYEYGLNPWDVAAGDIILRQAGGRLCDFKGKNDYVFGRELIASNSKIYEEFKEVIAKIMLSN